MSEHDWSNFYLIINVFLWVTTFCIYQYKTRYFGVGSALLLLYTGISISAIHIFNSDEYSYLYNELTLFPFVYLFGMIVLVSSPILSLKESQLKEIEPPSKLLLNTVCVCIIILVLVSLPNTILTIRENILLIILDEGAGKELYSSSAEALTGKAKSEMNIISILSNVCSNISLAFLCYYLTIEHKNKFILVGLIISVILQPLYSLANGVRATAAIFIFNTLFMLIFIRNMIPLSLKKKMMRSMFAIILLFLIPFISISLSRKGGDIEKAFLGIELYLSQGPLLFNNYGLDAGGIRYGDYTAVAFKYILGMDPAMYYSGRLNRYSHMKLDESQFYTFVGDFTLDYGPIWAVLIFIITAYFFKITLRQKEGRLTFHQFLLLYLLLTGCLGFYQFPLGREGGNLCMTAILLLVLTFKLAYDLRRRSMK